MFTFDLSLRFGREPEDDQELPGSTHGSAQLENATYEQPRRFDIGFSLPPE